MSATQAQLDALARGRRINVLNREVMPVLRKDHMTTMGKLFKKPNMHVGVFRVFRLPRNQKMDIAAAARVTKSLHQPLPTRGPTRRRGIKHHSRMGNPVFCIPIPSARAYEVREGAVLLGQLRSLHVQLMQARGTRRWSWINDKYVQIRAQVLGNWPGLADTVIRMEASHAGIQRVDESSGR